MGNIKDGFDIGVAEIQFWEQFKGRRVRVWPSDLTIRICSESGRKWVTSAEGREPAWWKESRKQYAMKRKTSSGPDILVEYAAEHLVPFLKS